MNPHVIIGNSAAAVGAIEGIRKYDKTAPVTVISDEPYHTYSRPLISYYLGGKVSEEKMRYRPADFYQKNMVETILGVRAESVDFKRKAVKLQDGRAIPYGSLLIATGGKPFIPPMEGLGKKGIFNFIKFDDVKDIEKAAVEGSKALVVGASFSGIKAVEALVKRGVSVTVVDLMDKVLPRVLDGAASAIALKALEAHGVSVILGNTVEKILGNEAVDGVILKDGSRIECDFIILAIGVRCNTDIAKDTEMKINRGILVDERMRTNIPDVYAAGDVTEGYNMVEKKNTEIATVPNAYQQGEVAGANMAGADRTFWEGFVMNSMPVFDLPIISAGIAEEKPDVEVIIRHDAKRGSYKKFYIRDNTLAGFLLITNVDRAGIYTDLIRSGTDVSGFKDRLGTEDFGLLSLPKDMRKEKMLKGGAAEW